MTDLLSEEERAAQEDGRYQPTVVEALSRVMRDVQSISKDSRNTQQNFNFRGVDAVVNAVGPVLREHGVVVVPVEANFEDERYNTKSGTAMRGVTVTIRFRFYGPKGDYIDACAMGEASDAGDKSIPKAHSVAYRTLLLQALCIPTDEPDPDAETHQRERVEERRVGGPTPNVPRSWAELLARMTTLLGAEEAQEWLRQAKEQFTEGTGPTLFQRCAGVLVDLEEETGDLWMDLELRSLVRRKFAARFDGLELEGPQWALNGPEVEAGYPSKEKALGIAQEEGVPSD